MPFDELRRRALEALEDRRESFHSAVATAVDEVRTILEANRTSGNGQRGERAAAELGHFAAGRIDTERFETLFSQQQTLDADAVERVEEALDTLTEILEAGDALHTLKVRSGEDLRTVVGEALAKAGRAFGAGRAVEAARAGTTPAEYRDGFGPERWNRAERSVAPPLVVEVDGTDLRPAGLADYLEGAQAIVLLVKKPAPAAALARLVAPGSLVAQGTDEKALEGIGEWDGPVAVGILPEGAAVFRYLPGEAGQGELTVASVPEGSPKPVGAISVSRQQSELQLLKLLEGATAGRVVEAAAGGGAGEAPADPADKLAAWLIRQASIPEPGEA
jgi:hypothetical protein